ncbi:MAG: hypothetical protein LBI81_01820 [Puniceicoccales bacterium]|jgi:hypothetical protein|nr:hypothetical protein [Puniceicoccales bacterium]
MNVKKITEKYNSPFVKGGVKTDKNINSSESKNISSEIPKPSTPTIELESYAAELELSFDKRVARYLFASDDLEFLKKNCKDSERKKNLEKLLNRFEEIFSKDKKSKAYYKTFLNLGQNPATNTGSVVQSHLLMAQHLADAAECIELDTQSDKTKLWLLMEVLEESIAAAKASDKKSRKDLLVSVEKCMDVVEEIQKKAIKK